MATLLSLTLAGLGLVLMGLFIRGTPQKPRRACASKGPEAERLARAIRAFTVDAERFGEPVPNGPAEAAWKRLADALLALPDPAGKHIAGLTAVFCDADAERLRELRQAAETYFGEDFRRPRSP